MNTSSKNSTLSMARTAFWMGLGSLILMPIIAVMSYMIEDMGMMSPFIRLVCPVALAAVIIGIISRKKSDRLSRSRRLATAGIISGAIAIGLTLLVIIIILVIFSPMAA